MEVRKITSFGGVGITVKEELVEEVIEVKRLDDRMVKILFSMCSTTR